MNLGFAAVLLSALVAVCLYAWFRGGKAERYGVVLYVAASVVAIILQVTQGLEGAMVSALALDTVTAFGFLILAFRYNSLWLGAVMVLQGVVLGLHTAHLTDASDARFLGFNLYALLTNLISLAMLIAFAFATKAAVKARKVESRGHAAVAAPQPA
ncbi:MAG: hypothetical protein ACXW3D_03175 [Caulobacteraceae bacterium]